MAPPPLYKVVEFKGEGGFSKHGNKNMAVGFPEKGGIFVSQATFPGQLKFSGWQ